MGWKEGQGIGSRKRRHRSGPITTRPVGDAPSGHAHPSDPTPGGPAQGLALDMSSIPEGAILDGEVLFAARDDAECMARMPPPKADLHGLGFLQEHDMASLVTRGHGIRGSDVYSVSDLLMTETGRGSGAMGGRLMGPRDQGGFAIDDGEDDVYDFGPEPSLPAVRTEEGSRLGQRRGVHTLGARNLIQDSTSVPLSGRRCGTDNRVPLEGFDVMSEEGEGEGTPSSPLLYVHYPPPKVPADFREWHVFEEPPAPQQRLRAAIPARAPVNYEPVDSAAVGSTGRGAVYDMLDAKGREQLDRALGRAKVKQEMIRGDGEGGGGNVGMSDGSIAAPVDAGKSTNVPARSNAMAQGLAAALRGRFAPSSASASAAGAPSDQARIGAQAAVETMVLRPGIVTAEELRAKRAMLDANERADATSQCPSAGAAAESSEVPARHTKRIITRVSAIWVPNRLLCKRMNVPVPDVALQLPTGTGAVIGSGREEELYQKHIGAYADLAAVPPTEGTASSTFQHNRPSSTGTVGPGSSSASLEVTIESHWEPPLSSRPPISLFKSVFEAESESDSTESGSDGESEGDDGSCGSGAVKGASCGGSGGLEGDSSGGMTIGSGKEGTAEHKESSDAAGNESNQYAGTLLETKKRKITATPLAETLYESSGAPAPVQSAVDRTECDKTREPPRIIFRKPRTSAHTEDGSISAACGVRFGTMHRQRDRRSRGDDVISVHRGRSANLASAARRSFETEDDADSDDNIKIVEQRKECGSGRTVKRHRKCSLTAEQDMTCTDHIVAAEPVPIPNFRTVRDSSVQRVAASAVSDTPLAASGVATLSIEKLKRLMQLSAPTSTSASHENSSTDRSISHGKTDYDGEDSIMEGGDGSKSGLEKAKDKCKHTRDERKKHKKKSKKSKHKSRKLESSSRRHRGSDNL